MLVSTLLHSKANSEATLFIEPNVSLFQAALELKKHNVGLLLVMTDGKLVGVLSERDIVRRGVLAELEMKTTPVEKIMTPNPSCVRMEESLEHCFKIINQLRCRHLPVMDAESKVVGVLSVTDIIQNLMSDYLERTQKDLENVLNNLGQGLMVFGRDGIILPGSSSITSTMFGDNPEGKNLLDVLKIDNPATRQSFGDWLGLLFEDIVPFGELSVLGPKAFSAANNRFIELEYRAIFEPNERTNSTERRIEKVICICSDITEKMELQKSIKIQQDFVKSVMAISQNRSAFHDFIVEFRRISESVQQELQKEVANLDLDSLLRWVHTLKGSAASFYFEHISAVAHEFENEILHIRNQDRSKWTKFIPLLREGILDLTQGLEEFVAENKGLIGDLATESARSRKVSMDTLIKLSDMLSRIQGDSAGPYRKLIDELVLEDFSEEFQKFELLVHRVARDQEKEVHFKIIESKVRVYLDPYKPLMASLVHIFRNAVGHGIETPEERESLGKPKAGEISIHVELFEKGKVSSVRFSISDDGRGIDPRKVFAKAKENRILPPNCPEPANENSVLILDSRTDQILNLVFEHGFSTADSVSGLSGRGVGLDAVKHEVSSLGGEIWVKTKVGHSTQFTIEVPFFNRPRKLI